MSIITYSGVSQKCIQEFHAAKPVILHIDHLYKVKKCISSKISRVLNSQVCQNQFQQLKNVFHEFYEFKSAKNTLIIEKICSKICNSDQRNDFH